MEVAPDPLHGLGSLDVSAPPPAAPALRGSSDPGTDGRPLGPSHEVPDTNKELKLLLNSGRNRISSVRFGNVRNPVTNFIS